MVVFAFQYIAVNSLAYVGVAIRWLWYGGQRPFRTLQRDLYFNASIPAYGGVALALAIEFGPF
jgi:hypothetical protein